MKNKFFPALYMTLKTSCFLFTLIVFAFYILGNAISNEVQVLTLTNLALIFGFSIWFTLSNILLKSNKLNLFLRVSLHFLSTLLGFFVIFIYIPGNAQNGSRAFILTIAFAALYILVAVIALIINGIVRKTKNENKEYKSVYEKSLEQ